MTNKILTNGGGARYSKMKYRMKDHNCSFMNYPFDTTS